MEVRLYHVNLDRGSNASTIWFNLDWIMEALHAQSRNVDRGGTLPLLGNSSRGGAPPLSGNPEGECMYPPSGTQRMFTNHGLNCGTFQRIHTEYDATKEKEAYRYLQTLVIFQRCHAGCKPQ
ncbi:hypothetical protein Q3G72_001964 [Acer saccharum]|nr:hypothetical protein Q3G72_001964 [Acer saccharum]